MQFCDGRKFEEYNPNLQSMYAQMEESEAIIFGMPVYQYSMSGVLKNILDICGGALKQKYVGIIVNAGWPNGYMASQDLFNALQFEYATTNIIPTPYSWFMDFENGKLVNEKVIKKLDDLVGQIVSL